MKTLKVANGFVKGQVKDVSGKQVVEFLSIPYCKPPVNELRFKKPQPCDTFSDEVINKLHFETCPPFVNSFSIDTSESITILEDLKSMMPKEKQDEDCLYVNIWCPLNILEGKEKRPVSIWIYGGGFVCGSSSIDSYQGDVLASHEDIIVVSFNYRVGALGFLCLGEMEMNGNLGIWDQVLALKWIHDNISVFNGDPENITIFGCSAGGFSVTLHMIIEESWPHFHKAVSESGVCFSDWGLRSKEEIVRRSVLTINKVLEKFKYPLRYDQSLSKEKKEEIIDFLQKVDFKEFLIDTEIVNGFFQLAWTPYLDGELIKSHPRTLLKNGKFKKCPTIILTSENEGSLFLFLMLGITEKEKNEIMAMKYFDKLSEFYPNFPIKCSDSVKDKIKEEYNVEERTLSIHTLDKIVSDQHFNCDSIEFAMAVSRLNSQVYYLWHRNFIPFGALNELRGATHGSEVMFFFGYDLRTPLLKKYNEISEYTMNRFGEFLRTGHLNKDFSHFDEASKSFIDCSGANWHKGHFSDDQMHKVEFWRNLRRK